MEYNKSLYANGQKIQFYENISQNEVNQPSKLIYSNVHPPLDVNTEHEQDDEFPPPPSPVSSSYSELRRATDGNNSSNGYATTILPPPINHQYHVSHVSAGHHHQQQMKNQQQTYSNDYGVYGPSSQNSTTYESIYEPINPRPPSQMSSRSNYSLYAPYVDDTCSNSSSMQRLPIINQESEVDALTDLLVQSMHQANPEPDSYGICVKCEGIVSESFHGCTAMENVYHIACFTCHQCQMNLQGKPFYALESQPYCEEDYMNTLEKCSVCMEPILERILRATGKPYHPACFACIVCGKSLDGIPFTVDATNQIHCIEDFHKFVKRATGFLLKVANRNFFQEIRPTLLRLSASHHAWTRCWRNHSCCCFGPKLPYQLLQMRGESSVANISLNANIIFCLSRTAVYFCLRRPKDGDASRSTITCCAKTVTPSAFKSLQVSSKSFPLIPACLTYSAVLLLVKSAFLWLFSSICLSLVIKQN